MTEPWTLLCAVVSMTMFVLTLCMQRAVVTVLRREPPSGGPAPPISVLKPVKGVDEGLLLNLRALAEQDYPDFEILIGAEEASDAALAVARQLQREYPHLSIRVFWGSAALGLNPKVNTLALLARAARHDHLLISDSNVRPRRDYLKAMAAELVDQRVGLVWSLHCGVGGRGIGAVLENLHMNTFVAAAVCGADVISGHSCVIGKSMLLRRRQLEELGGFSALANVLAEDYVLGQLYARAGYKVALSAHVLDAVHDERRVLDFAARHLRWSQMRRWIHPGLFLLEPLSNATVGLLFTLLLAATGAPEARLSGAVLGAIALGAFIVKTVLDARLVRRLGGRSPGVSLFLWMVVKDLLIAAVWALALVRRRVSWRGHTLQIGPGSVLSSPGSRRAPLPLAEPG